MKKLIVSACAFSLFAVISCKKEAKTDVPATGDSVTTVMPKDSAAAPKTDSATSTPAVTASADNIITKNTGKYPHDIKLFEDKSFADRVKKLTGAQYDEM